MHVDAFPRHEEYDTFACISDDMVPGELHVSASSVTFVSRPMGYTREPMLLAHVSYRCRLHVVRSALFNNMTDDGQ